MDIDTDTVDPLALIAHYRSHLQLGQGEIRTRYLAGGDAPRLLQERCRLIDLGRWLNEEHAVPCNSEIGEEEEEPSDGTPKLPPGWHDA